MADGSYLLTVILDYITFLIIVSIVREIEQILIFPCLQRLFIIICMRSIFIKIGVIKSPLIDYMKIYNSMDICKSRLIEKCSG